MKTVSLTLCFFGILTIGFAATGCAAEADSSTSSADDAISEEQASTGRAGAPSEDELDVDAERRKDVPMLAREPGPHPGNPITRAGEGLPPNPNPCPGIFGPGAQVW